MGSRRIVVAANAAGQVKKTHRDVIRCVCIGAAMRGHRATRRHALSMRFHAGFFATVRSCPDRAERFRYAFPGRNISGSEHRKINSENGVSRG